MENTQKTNLNTTTKTKNILVTRDTIAWISYNYKLTEKAKQQLVDSNLLDKGLKKIIFNSPLAWRDGSKTIIALDLYNYIIVELKDNVPEITEISNAKSYDENYTVIDKMVAYYKELEFEIQLSDDKCLKEIAEKLYVEAIQYQSLKVALIQRIFNLGYAKAVRIKDRLQDEGIVESNSSSSNSQILCDEDQFIESFIKAYKIEYSSNEED